MTEGSGAYGAIEAAALGIRDGRIAWLGPRRDLPASARDASREVHDLAGRWVTPGLIDCHTHLVYAGHRAGEFERRLQGASYEEIARAGGGIRSTVAHTRAASEDQLAVESRPRLLALRGEGVTTVEIKSGYGLDRESECKMLRVATRLGAEHDVTVQRTFLGAHALPEAFAGRPDEYITQICEEMLPAAYAEGRVDAVDAFCENIGFDRDQVRRVFEAARALGLPVKLHAEQLSDQKGAVLAAEFQALSADHLEYLGPDGVQAMAEAGTAAVLLPGAYYFLRETRLPPIQALRDHRIPIALATDSNPGSSPVTSPLLMMSMGCTLFRLTPEECLAGFTRNAARALGMQAEIGTLEVGKRADLAVWNVDEPAELAYHIGRPLLERRYFGGRRGSS